MALGLVAPGIALSPDASTTLQCVVAKIGDADEGGSFVYLADFVNARKSVVVAGAGILGQPDLGLEWRRVEELPQFAVWSARRRLCR